MDEQMQEPSAPSGAADADRGIADAPAPLEPTGPDPHRGLLLWLAFIAVAGIAGLFLGAQEMSLMVALGGLFLAARMADLDSRWTLFYWLVSGIVPVGGCAVFAALATFAGQAELTGAPRAAAVGVSIFAALVSLISILRPFTDELVLLLFRTHESTHQLRLAARVVLLGLLFAVPGYFVMPGMMEPLMTDRGGFFSHVSFESEVVGYVALAFAAVGYLVSRDLRATLARLGLTRPKLSHVWIVVAGLVTLVALNSGADWAQHRWFRTLWEHDRQVNLALARGLSVPRIVMLGLTAGIGEEITLRGALQPRLGVPLTALLFASLHVQYSWYGMIVVGLIGLALGLIRRYANTSSSILVHALYDVAAVIST